MERDMPRLREEMVARHLAARGIKDPAVLEAFRQVPREEFVAKHLRNSAYADSPLPIGEGQTISQPYIVALMIEALELSVEDLALDIGTGSGYAAALLSRIAAEVYTVERFQSLAEAARERFKHLGYHNIQVRIGDGSLGWPEHSPYDAIVSAAGAPEVPQPLARQLAPGGRLVIPVGDPTSQILMRIRRFQSGKEFRESLGEVRFVPLVGSAAWSEEEAVSASLW